MITCSEKTNGQCTLNKSFGLEGIEPYGGNTIHVYFYPAEPNTGIIFATERGNIEARLDLASEYKSSILLGCKNLGILHSEHLLATLYAYGVDNALIHVQREPSISFSTLNRLGLSTHLEVIPDFYGKTYGLCEKLDGNIENQMCSRRLLTLNEKIGDLYIDKLVFEPVSERGLTIEAITKYPFLGEQKLCLNIDGVAYKKEISRSRPYAKHGIGCPLGLLDIVASLANPSFGIGHGFDAENGIMLPIMRHGDTDRAKSIYASGDEPVRHTIMDRLGVLSLLPGRLTEVKVTARFSGHANDITMLKRVLPYLKIANQ